MEDPIEVHSYSGSLQSKLGVSLPKMSKALYQKDQFNFMMKFKTTEAYNWDANQGQGTLPVLEAPLKQTIDPNNNKKCYFITSIRYTYNCFIPYASSCSCKWGFCF